MKLALDTSALVKRYREEAGRAQLLTLLEQASAVVVAAHSKVELASTFARAVHDREIALDDYTHVMGYVEADFRDFTVQPLSAQTERLAISAMLSARLRAMDALHVGAAQAAEVDCFVTADVRQAQAARAVGLTTELLEV